MSDNTQVRQYWNSHIHDLDVSSSVPGSREFFADLDQYHFEKLHHLPRLIDFDAYRGKRVLDVGCGAGTDLARFAKGGALVSGVDLSLSAIALATQNFAQQGLAADLREADGEHLPFADGSFDFVFAHGVVQYTAHDKALVDECRRVLAPGGILRAGVPDFGRYAESYAGDRAFLEARRPGRPTPLLALAEVALGHGHRSVWDAETLERVLSESGLVDVSRRDFGDSALAPAPDNPLREPESVYAEGRAA